MNWPYGRPSTYLHDMTQDDCTNPTHPKPGFNDSMTVEDEETMDRHFARLQGLRAESRFQLAGSCPDGAFGVVFLCESSGQGGGRMMEGDPAVRSGMMQAEIHRLHAALL
jgi:uncharacterized protein YciI